MPTPPKFPRSESNPDIAHVSEQAGLPLRRAWNQARRWSWASLVAQMLIVVTGAFVRVTASGLGCPTWPQCMPGSYTPVTVPETVYHAWVEFGNRLLTFAVAVTAIGALASNLWAKRKRAMAAGWASGTSGTLLAASGLIGTAAQAVVGGISVLTGLSPAWVAAHFLLSTVILIAQTRYVAVFTTTAPSPTAWSQSRMWVPLTLCLAAWLTVLLGTIVTGAGPHAGDVNVTERFQIDPQLATAIHAGAAATLVIATAVVALRRAALPRDLRNPVLALLILQLAQGSLGVLQYQAGLPPLMVVAHVALAVSIWVGTLRLLWRWRAHNRQMPVL